VAFDRARRLSSSPSASPFQSARKNPTFSCVKGLRAPFRISPPSSSFFYLSFISRKAPPPPRPRARSPRSHSRGRSFQLPFKERRCQLDAPPLLRATFAVFFFFRQVESTFPSATSRRNSDTEENGPCSCLTPPPRIRSPTSPLPFPDRDQHRLFCAGTASRTRLLPRRRPVLVPMETNEFFSFCPHRRLFPHASPTLFLGGVGFFLGVFFFFFWGFFFLGGGGFCSAL